MASVAEARESAPKFLTVDQFCRQFPWPTTGGLRHLIFNAESNGFAPAFKRVGRRVLVDQDVFWRIVEEKGVR